MRALVIALAAMAAIAGCDSGPACGIGTEEVAGLCLPTTTGQPAACGPKTRWDSASETCVGVSTTVCSDGTTAVEQDDGTTLCIGGPVPAEAAR